MNPHGNKFKIFSGNANRPLAEKIAAKLGTTLSQAEVSHFKDGEISISISESVRGCDVFVIQSTCTPVNDNLMELLIMIDALRRASAERITAVMPYFGYARQDRKAKARDPISAKLVANMLTAAGADRVLTMDLHANQIQGFFDIPVDNLTGAQVFKPFFAEKIGFGNPDYVIVSPDLGSVGRARGFTEYLNLPLAIIDKRRQRANVSEVMNIIGDVRGKHVILLDDMIDTAGTLCNGAKALVDVGGALDVTACATHAVLSGPAIDNLAASKIKELYLLDTIPLTPEKQLDKFTVLSVADIFSEAIRRIREDGSVSELF